MHHLIYIPDAFKPEDRQLHPLAAVGLPDHVANADKKPLAEGPDGGKGTLFAWLGRSATKQWHYSKDEQTWSPAAASEDLPAGRFCVGTWNDSPPTPDELKRPGKEPWGEPVEMGGQTWLLTPVDLLPRTLGQFSDGSGGLRVRQEFRHLAEDREAWVARLCGPPTMVPLVEMAGFLASVLAVNYRIDLTLALHLELFDESNVKDLMLVALRPRAYYMAPTED